MAKDKKSAEDLAKEQSGSDTVAPAAEGAAAAPAEGAAPAAKKVGGGGNAIILANGMKRAEYIRQEFNKGRKRGEIAKELGVAYQIVFAATKGMTQPATVPAASDATPAEAPAAA